MSHTIDRCAARGNRWTTRRPQPTLFLVKYVARMADSSASSPKGRSNTARRLRHFYEDHIAVLGSKAVKVVVQRPGPCIMVAAGFLFVLLIISIVMLGLLQPRCFSSILPCAIEEVGKCLCSVRGTDGTCWQRMTPAMKCYKATQLISSGVCQGIYMTGFCARTQEAVTEAVDLIGVGFVDLHPNLAGQCNLTFVQEGSRCALPYVRQDAREFDQTDCCRAPMQTCVSDLDCCNCGIESPDCLPTIQCRVTKYGPDGTTSNSQTCDVTEDACLSYTYPKCRGLPEECDDTEMNIPYSYDGGVTEGDNACCEAGTCPCRSVCAKERQVEGWPGCPCVQGANGCEKKTCIKSSDFYVEGGIQHKLRQLGATDVRLCFTDNCNQ